jgi:hypothetical protein
MPLAAKSCAGISEDIVYFENPSHFKMQIRNVPGRTTSHTVSYLGPFSWILKDVV